MAYAIGIGDGGPPMQILISHPGFVLQVTDTCTLRYMGPDKILRTKALTIVNAPSGELKISSWLASELPAAGLYQGRVKVERVADPTFPRTFPNDGTSIVWPVAADLQ